MCGGGRQRGEAQGPRGDVPAEPEVKADVSCKSSDPDGSWRGGDSAPRPRLHVPSLGASHVRCRLQSSKKTITKEEWEKKLAAVKIRKEDMNLLVMNFLVTEVRMHR